MCWHDDSYRISAPGLCRVCQWKNESCNMESNLPSPTVPSIMDAGSSSVKQCASLDLSGAICSHQRRYSCHKSPEQLHIRQPKQSLIKTIIQGKQTFFFTIFFFQSRKTNEHLIFLAVNDKIYFIALTCLLSTLRIKAVRQLISHYKGREVHTVVLTGMTHT